jgi:hypothetical protein
LVTAKKATPPRQRPNGNDEAKSIRIESDRLLSITPQRIDRARGGKMAVGQGEERSPGGRDARLVPGERRRR